MEILASINLAGNVARISGGLKENRMSAAVQGEWYRVSDIE